MSLKIMLRSSAIVLLVVLLAITLASCADMGVKMEVVFDENIGEDGITTFKVKNPQDFVLPSDPVRENYVFDGWYLDNGKWKEPFTVQSLLDLPISEEMELKVYAKWLGNPHTVHFDCATADAPIADATVRYGEAYRLPVPTNGKETFLGWSRNGALLTDAEGASSSHFEFTSDITLTPLWKEGRVDLTLDSGNGKTETISAWLGDAVGQLPTPERADYLFLGWFTAPEGGEQITAETVSSFTENTTLYAHWATEFCLISFDGNASTSGNTAALKVAHGNSATLPACGFAKTGHTFAGWELNGKIYQTGASLSDTAPDSIVLRAAWIPNTVTVSFDCGTTAYTGSMSPVTLTYGEGTVIPPLSYERHGYVFTGWKYGSTTLSNCADIGSLLTTNGATLKLVAQWRPITYIIRFDGNGATYGEIPDVQCVYDQEVMLPFCTLAREGHTFKGWTSSTGEFYADGASRKNWGMLNQDGAVYVLTASWTPNQYRVQLSKNGGEGSMNAYSVTYGNKLTLPDCKFTNTGYTFVNWFTYDEDYNQVFHLPGDSIVITEETTVYAHWEMIFYQIHIDPNGGTNTAEDLTLLYDEYAWLSAESLSRPGYTLGGFRHGNKLYTVGDRISKLTDRSETVTLTAVWKYVYEGDGTAASPYLIPNAEAFLALSDFLQCSSRTDFCFALTADMDLQGAVFSTIPSFEGILDGRGHTVSNFTIDGLGLVKDLKGALHDLHLSDVSLTANVSKGVSGYMGVGTLVSCNQGTVSGCTVTDATMQVTVTSSSCPVGGLVGISKGGAITNCLFRGEIHVTSTPWVYVGGLCGSVSSLSTANVSAVTLCYASVTVDVTAPHDIYVGSCFGSAEGSNTIAYVFGEITASVSASDPTYSTGVHMGALLGKHTTAVTLIDCFGAARGLKLNGAAVTADDTDTVEQAAAEDLRSLSWMQEHLPAFTAGNWSMTNGELPLPVPSALPRIEIASKEELIALSGKALTAHYVLTNDIDLTGEVWKPAVLFGIFEGNGHSIKGLSFEKAVHGRAGLFSVNYGTVQNLLLKDCAINATFLTATHAGTIAGENLGVIRACHVSGSITVLTRSGSAWVGGIAGIVTNGCIRDCYVTANVTATGGSGSRAGGIAADAVSASSIVNCYTDGTILFTNDVRESTASAYGIAPIAMHSFSLANVDVKNVYTKSVYHYSGPQSLGCYGCTTQYSFVDNDYKSPETLMSVSFLKNMGWGRFTSEEDLASNPSNVWVYDGSDLPVLWFEV